MSYSVYILRSASNKLYIGQTNNILSRTKQHIYKDPKAAKFTKDGFGFRLVYSEEYSTRVEAMRRENQLKGWSRAKKEALIKNDIKMLKELSRRKL